MKKGLNDFIKESEDLDGNFERKFDINTRMISLTEEVGELSHAFLINEGRKKDGTSPTISENLTNLLHEVFLIASHYKIDLDVAWEEFLRTMPGWAEKRNK